MNIKHKSRGVIENSCVSFYVRNLHDVSSIPTKEDHKKKNKKIKKTLQNKLKTKINNKCAFANLLKLFVSFFLINNLNLIFLEII